MATHISFLHASMVGHMQNPYSEFHSVTIRTHQVLFPLSIVAPWVNFKTQYHDFMMTRTQGGWVRFQHQGVWTTITAELLLREELEQKGITL